MVIWKRKLYRIIIGSIFPTVYLITKNSFLPLIFSSFFLTLLLALEYERYKNPFVWEWILKHFGSTFKPSPGILTGDTCFMLSSFFSILLFPMEIAIFSLYFLVFGDAGSAIIGSKFGKISIFPGKTFEGMVGGMFFNFILCFLLLFIIKVKFMILITGILLNAIFEVLPLKIDDNLTTGIIPGIIMSLLYIL